MKKSIISLLALANTSAVFATPTADIAILLDTSGSMESLIAQVRDGMWKTLNGLSGLEKDGEKAVVRLALFEYGSGAVSEEANFIQLLSPLTTDHGALAAKLFATKAEGGTEYSGMAIDMAKRNLSWSQDSADFKAIVVAGNETIHQGPVKPLLSAADALSEDILVNTIFAGASANQVFNNPCFNTGFGFGGGFGTPCEDNSDPEAVPNPIFLEWEEMATAGGGKALNIDHNSAIKYIESPFDQQIVELTEKVTETMLPFGKNGAQKYKELIDLDNSIKNSGAGSYMDWGSYNSGGFGVATLATWDLVTAIDNKNFDLASIEDEDLPKSMQGKSLAEKEKIVLAMKAKREQLNTEIAALKENRNAFIEAKKAEDQGKAEKDFAEAFEQILHKQLKDKGFKISLN
jgi:hypothetical protein